MLSIFSQFRVLQFLWRSNILSPNSGLKNIIFPTFIFWASVFMVQVSRRRNKAAFEVMLLCINLLKPSGNFTYHQV
jgi:hypothetical protein